VTTIARPSVASLFLHTIGNGNALGSATGFVVEHHSGRFLITNRHVVRGRSNDERAVNLHSSGAWPDTIMVMHNVANQLGNWRPVSERLYSTDGSPNWLEHSVFGPAIDVVALPLTITEGFDFYSYGLGEEGHQLAVGVAQPLSIVGFPFGITGGGAFGVWVQGTIATELEVDWNGLPAFLIDSRTRQGQSGSPVIAFHSGGAATLVGGTTALGLGKVEKFMGVYSGRINAESDLGIVWKKSVMLDLVERGVSGTP
jgi:hypothetical protein